MSFLRIAAGLTCTAVLAVLMTPLLLVLNSDIVEGKRVPKPPSVSIMSGSTARSFARSIVSSTIAVKSSQCHLPVICGVTANRIAEGGALFGRGGARRDPGLRHPPRPSGSAVTRPGGRQTMVVKVSS